MTTPDQAPELGEFEIKAKPLEWEVSWPGRDYAEHRANFGFSVTEDHSEEPEYVFYACWGEDQGEHFATLDEAKACCQEELDSWVKGSADISPLLAQVKALTEQVAELEKESESRRLALKMVNSMLVESEGKWRCDLDADEAAFIEDLSDEAIAQGSDAG